MSRRDTRRVRLWALVLPALAASLACGSGGTASSTDAADTAVGDSASEPASESGAPETSTPASCKTNAECASGWVCYFSSGAMCTDASGVCVRRLDATCNQSIGAGCPCLDVSGCSGGSLPTACRGDDRANQCWYCYLPS